MINYNNSQKLVQPLTFEECIGYSAEQNATVRAISNFKPDYDQFTSCGGDLEDLIQSQKHSTSKRNPKKFIEFELINLLGDRNYIPLTKSVFQSSDAMALYAGDGLVAKITEESYLRKALIPFDEIATTLPRVIPPILTRNVENFYIELFPWIDQSNVSESDVEELSSELQQMGLIFCRGDKRVDNVGRLADGTLAILDGNAIEIAPFNSENDKKQFEDSIGLRLMKWCEMLERNFPELYMVSDEANLGNHLAAFFHNPTNYSFDFPVKVR